jgi:Calcineurin-like phosphoesterase
MIHRASDSPPAASKRTVVIGDVHGCIEELHQLLDKVEVRDDDDIISVGDLVRKGPDSAAVLRWAMKTPNLRCVLGNHDARLLFRWFDGEKPDRGSLDWVMCRELGDSYNDAMEYIRSCPLYIDSEEFLVVHAGLDPRIGKIRLQSPRDLMNIRIPQGMKAPWYESYEEEKLVIFGHWARNEPLVRSNTICLDTGCVYGGRLTAAIFPEGRLVSVPAKKAYQSKD